MEQLNNLPYSSIADALQYQSEIRPDKLVILYPDPKKNSTEYASLTYQQFNHITNYLAEKIRINLPLEESVTCGLLAVGGIEYFLSQYALLKIENVIMFPISPRNSQSAIEHLLRETKTKLLLTTSQYLPMIDLIKQQNNEFQSLKILLFDSEQFQIEELLKNKDSISSNSIKQRINNKEELNKVVIILHR
jgi:acyl-CoA synthetase (AMP-forming)/AMP-acid ligase II